MPVAGVVWLAGLAALEWVLSGGVILLLAENPGSSELEPTAAITTPPATQVMPSNLPTDSAVESTLAVMEDVDKESFQHINAKKVKRIVRPPLFDIQNLACSDCRAVIGRIR